MQQSNGPVLLSFPCSETLLLLFNMFPSVSSLGNLIFCYRVTHRVRIFHVSTQITKSTSKFRHQKNMQKNDAWIFFLPNVKGKLELLDLLFFAENNCVNHKSHMLRVTNAI